MMNTNDIINIQKILAPYGINIIHDSSKNESITVNLIIPENSKIKNGNRFVKGDYALKFARNTINKYIKDNNIKDELELNIINSNSTWTYENSEDIKKIIEKF